MLRLLSGWQVSEPHTIAVHTGIQGKDKAVVAQVVRPPRHEHGSGGRQAAGSATYAHGFDRRWQRDLPRHECRYEFHRHQHVLPLDVPRGIGR